MKLGATQIPLPGPRNPVVQACVALILVAFIFRHIYSIPAVTIFPYEPGPTNATLGFGKIFVTTDDATTWRVQGLRRVAREYHLDLTIPIQKRRTDAETSEYLKGDTTGGIPNDARCILGHMAVLEMFVASGAETGLILEDDVDFSIHIKSQMQLLSKVVYENFADRSATPEQRSLYPYGRDVWDIFWVGHWGIEFADGVRVASYDDPYALKWPDLRSTFNNYYTQQAASGATNQELVYNVAPMTTYAYAVTRDHAIALLKKFRTERPPEIDVAMHVECKAKRYRCMAPVPELFHHHKVVGQSSIEVEGVHDGQVHDLTWWSTRHKYTYNINGSARCNAAQLGDKVGNSWQCLPGSHDETI